MGQALRGRKNHSVATREKQNLACTLLFAVAFDLDRAKTCASLSVEQRQKKIVFFSPNARKSFAFKNQTVCKISRTVVYAIHYPKYSVGLFNRFRRIDISCTFISQVF